MLFPAYTENDKGAAGKRSAPTKRNKPLRVADWAVYFFLFTCMNRAAIPRIAALTYTVFAEKFDRVFRKTSLQALLFANPQALGGPFSPFCVFSAFLSLSYFVGISRK